MTTEQPTRLAIEQFDESLNDAVHAVIAEMQWLGLPDEGTDQRTALLHELNDAIGAIMREWL